MIIRDTTLVNSENKTGKTRKMLKEPVSIENDIIGLLNNSKRTAVTSQVVLTAVGLYSAEGALRAFSRAKGCNWLMDTSRYEPRWKWQREGWALLTSHKIKVLF